MSGAATNLRAAIAMDPAVDFGFRVRCWRSGEIWVTPEHGSPGRCDALMARLRALGFEPRMEGEPGTAGQWIIEI